MKIRVLHVGLGPIGAAVVRQTTERAGIQTVAAVDIDEKKVNRDVGEMAKLPRPLRVKVPSDIGRAIKTSRPDVAVLCTGSSLKQVLPLIEQILKQKVPIVSTTEELSYPAGANRRLARK